MKLKLFYLFLLCYIPFSYGQQKKVDSLLQLLSQTQEEVAKLKILDQLNEYYINTSTKKLIENSKEIVGLAKDLQKPVYLAKAYRYIAEAGLRTHNFEMAKKNAEIALIIDDSLQDYKNLVLDYNQLGRAYYNFNRPEKAIEIYKKAIALDKQHPGSSKIGVVYGNIGAAYNLMNQPYNALTYFLKQAEIAEKNARPVQKSKVNYNIGYTYMQMDQLPKAEKYFKKALQDSGKIEVKDYVYVNFHALGMLYSRMKKYDEALQANQKALGYFNSTQNKMYQFDLHNNNAAIYLKKEKKEKAIAEAQKALQIAKSIGFDLGIKAARTSLANIYTHFGDYAQAQKLLDQLQKQNIQHHELRQALYENLYEINKHYRHFDKALLYHEKLKKLSDSILKSQRDSKIAEIETRYQTEKKEKENLQLKAEKASQQLLIEQKNKQNTYLSAGFAVALISLGIFAFYYRRNQRQKKLIEHLQKDLHHRIKNNLAIIDALVEDIKDDFEETGIYDRLVDLQNRINSINEIHWQLYHNQDITKLDLKTYVDRISEPIQKAFGNKHVKILNQIPEKLLLDIKKSFPLGLIINEFITNSFKYAFDEGKSGEIHIALNEQGKDYVLHLSDNGKGLPEGLDISNLDSFGMSIMQLLAQQLHGTFQIKNDKGLHVEIRFPKS